MEKGMEEEKKGRRRWRHCAFQQLLGLDAKATYDGWRRRRNGKGDGGGEEKEKDMEEEKKRRRGGRRRRKENGMEDK